MEILYSHRTRGKGVEGVHIRGVVGALRGLGQEVTMASLPGTECERIENAVSSRLAKMWKLVSSRAPGVFFEFLEIGYNMVSIFKIWRILRSKRIDFIYERYAMFNFAGVVMARFYKLPILLEINDVSTLDRVRKLRMKRIAEWFEQRIFDSASALVTISTYFKEHLIERGFPAERIWVLPNAIEPSVFSPKQADGYMIREHYKFNSAVVVGFVGRFEPWHGIDFLISTIPDIIASGKNVRFMFVGGDDEKAGAALRAHIQDKGISDNITFTGWVKHDLIPSYIAAMDIAVIPNSNVYGSPMKLFEYMAMGKAVVAPRLGPIEDVATHDKDIVLFEPGDKGSLKSALGELIKDAAKRQRIGGEALKTVQEKHTWQRNGEKILFIFESIRR